ncbi:MAG: MATE family efflux transporter [Dehalococcoidales bacterium]|nr:MATE family efflux transporter [Dehalococcoidales bacterium]
MGKLLFKLGTQSVLSLITVALYNTVDTFWVARLGHEAIAALTIVLPYQMIFHAIGMGTRIGITALVSRRFGERDIEATNRAAGQVFFISIFWGVLSMLAAIFFSDTILPALGATPDIMDPATSYMINISFGASQIIFVVVAGSLIRGSGDAFKPMIMMIAASVIHIVLDPFMILWIGPFPELGVRGGGAALATAISQSIGAAIGLYYLFARKTSFNITVRSLLPDFSIIKDIYRVGAPAAILEITQSVSFILFNKVLSGFGSLAIAGVGLPFRVSDLTFVQIMGASNALLPIVGFSFGARNFKRLWEAVKIASVGITILLAVATVFVEIFAPQILGIFTKDQRILELAIPAMRIMLCPIIFIGPTLMFITVFQGLSRGTMALVLSLLRQLLLFIPAIYLMSHFFGLYGLLWALPLSDFLSFGLTFTFTYREYRKHRKHYLEMSAS